MTKSNHDTIHTFQKDFLWLMAPLFIVALLNIFSSAAQTSYTTPGTYSFPVPVGTTLLKVECWGGGGGGSNVSTNPRGGGGGGGGAYAKSFITVSQSSYSLTVGSGGAQNAKGGNSYFNGSDVLAVGGNGATSNANTAGSGGLATNSFGTVKWSGGNGANGVNSSYSGGGGGGAGSTAAGQPAVGRTGGIATVVAGGAGATGLNSRGSGATGSANGGGGSGGYMTSSSAYSGGVGGSGGVVISLCLVEVTSTLGTPLDYYETLKAAVDAINAGVHKGSITIKLLSSTTEANAITLNASSGTASYTDITLYPTSDGLSISGSVATSLLTLKGSTNVTIDGRVNGTGSTVSLIISNTNTAATTSTIQFNTTAQYNTVKYCKVLGGGGGATNGTILFGTTGTNTGNTIDNCTITNNGTRRINAVYSTTSTGSNINNSITHTTFYNSWLTTATSSNFINLAVGSSGWTITDNSFYDTGFATLTVNTARTYTAINLSNTGSYGSTVSRNYIGGQAPVCGGSSMSMGTSGIPVVFYPINLNVGTTSSTIVEDNVIQNINYSSSSTAPFVGIFVVAGAANVNRNSIGDVSGSTSLNITTTNASTTVPTISYGIQTSSTGTVNVTNNTISKVTLAASTTYAHSFMGISKTATAGTLTITGNLIGHNSTSGSITISCTSTPNATGAVQTLYGINSLGTGAVTISDNIVANLVNATTNANTGIAGLVTGIFSSAGTNIVSGNTVHDLSISNANNSTTVPSACGLLLSSTTVNKNVSGNTIYNISNALATATAVNVVGLYYAGATSGTNIVEKNLIYGVTASNSTALVQGLDINSGLTTYSNNIINLSNSQNGVIYGAYDAGLSGSGCNFYHNTIYIGGTASGSAQSYAFYSATANNTRNYRNNIFFNARSGSGFNFAIYYATASPNYLTADYNDYRVTGTNGTVGYYSSSQTLATLQTALGEDANSIDTDPGLSLAGGSLASDYKTQINLIGVSAGVTVDYGNGTRYSYTMGAWEFLPIEVWKNSTKQAAYGDLKSAFDKINDGTWTGDLTIKVKGSTNETGSVVLNASGVGGASYTRLLVYPESSDMTITGNFNNPLISLNGADNVCINGSVFQNNTSASLTFLNNSTGTSASVLKFSESAQNNSIKYCFLKGNPASATQGIVVFSTATVGTGNRTDTIAYCMISGTGSTSAGRPYNALYSAGTLGSENSGINLIGNQFYDFFNPDVASNGILIADNSTAFTISGNSFYESAAFTPTADVAYNVVNINNTSGGSYSITDNYIGGNAPSCVGVWTKTGHDNLFNGIRLNVGSSNRSSVQGNTIKGFNYTNSLNANWYGVNVVAGGVDIGTITGNTLGESTGTGSITLTNTTTSGNFYGVYVASTSAIDCQNNTFGSINVGITDNALSTNFYGIYKAAGAGDITIRNNMVGGTTTENSLIASSIATANIQTVYGIYSASTGLSTISGNTVSNLVNATTNGLLSFTRGIFTNDGSNTIDNNSVHHISSLNAQLGNYTNATLIGIEQISEQAGSTQLIRGNKVYSLRNRTSATIEMYGIFYIGPADGNNEISRNFVHTFIIISTDAAYLHGISLHTGAYTCSNNVVFLGDTIATGCRIWGIWNNSSSTVKIYHNTVYINGKATSGVSNSFAYRDLSLAPTNRDVRNNIFWNERLNTVTPIAHYAFFLNDTANTTLNYNDYQFAQKFALVEGTTYSTQQEWVDASPFDDNSISTNPLLTNLGGISPSDYQPGVALPGVVIAGQTTDYGGALRGDPPTMGAWEYVSNPVEVLNGSTHLQDYKTLKLAFDSINAGIWKGDLTLKIKANITETAKAVLYQSGYTGAGGTSSYTRVHIYPSSNDLQILGNLDSALIELNGARGVVFDGRVNGTGASYNLTLQNNRVGANASTISFLNSAEVDSIKLCVIKGLSTNPNGGIVHFSTSNAGTGNKNNCINSNKITVVDSNPSVKSRVINAIYSEGTSGKENKDNCILNNEIFDVWSQGASSYGIHVGPNSTAFTITGNSIYETTTFIPSAANTYNGIRINNTSGNGFVLSGNFIGGKAVQCQGSPLLIGTTTFAFAVQPIYLNVGTSTATSVQGNTINNFNLTSPNATPFSGIYVNAGAVNIGTTTGNNIGATTGIESIYLIGVASASASYGVYVNSTAAVAITNNVFGSVSTDVTGSTAYGHSFYGIYKAAVAGNLSVTGNVIGSLSTSSSIQAVSAATANAQSVYGIYSLGTGATTIYNNTIANLRDNTTYSSANSNIEAIYLGGVSSSNTIERNFIYGLTHACTASTASNLMAGIHLESGSTSILNNIIWIGSGVTNSFWIYGIYDKGVASQTNLIYHNTIYLSGTPSGTTRSSYAYFKSVNAGTTNIRNNIFYNARSGGSTGHHYALSLPGLTSLTINANDYVCSGGTFLNFYTSDRTTLGTWKTATSQDAVSLNATPFTAPASALAINFRPMLDLAGVNVSTAYDYGLNPRNATTPTIGAWERVNKWKGSISIDFNTPSNWTFNMVPANWDNIIFDDAPNRPCTMDTDRYVTDIVNNQATYRMIVNGFSLTIKGNLTFANGAQVDASATGSTLVFNGLSAQSIPSGSLYNNKVYNLNINNSNNVTLNGTLVLLNNLTTAIGKLNAASTGATFTYGGTSPQTIESNCFLNEKVYNLTIDNPAGVTLNTTFTADNNMTIQTGASFIIPETRGLTVTGLLTNSAIASSLLLKSSATGTASLIQTFGGAQATVQRYIDGDTLAWHFMSSPVASQSISGSWTPSGTYGDNTGYDLYLWDEPHSCWVYNLNGDSIPAWITANSGNAFVPGRGYLYAVQAFTPTKQFVGNLNGGTLTRPLTITAAGNYKGFNLLGNPYPSSIDWSLGGGFTRNMLYLNGSGYDIWTWSSTAKNYGVYNSADASGTNNVTRYIAPMQAFFVRASTAGTFSFKNDARVHNGASVWLKSAQSYNEEQDIRLTVASSAGSDEVRFGFGYPVNESGAMKLFSPVETAPSLYMNCSGSSFSTRRLTDTSRNKYVPVNFKAGEAGTYTLNCTYDASTLGAIFLEDRLTDTILDLSGGDSYTFQASVTDAAERFVLHFGAVTPLDDGVHPNVWVSAGMLNVYLENMIGDYTMRVCDLQGRPILYKKMSGSEQCSIPLFGRGIYLVTVESKSKSQSIKVIY